jgi:ATP phosphoribosyltransferase regulatory subunit
LGDLFDRLAINRRDGVDQVALTGLGVVRLDLKQWVAAVPALPLRAAIRAPWGDAADLHDAIAGLRAQGETVVCVLPGHESEVDEFHCDRTLVKVAGQWVVQAL